MRFYFTLVVPLLISSLFALSTAQQKDPDQQLINDIDAAKLKIAQLETALEETVRNVDSKTLYLKDREVLIQDSDSQIRDLQSALSSVKSDLPEVQKWIRELEEEVKLLWAALRASNFDLHILKEKEREADDKVQVAALEVEKMSDFVTEQWIQIQHLEQMVEFNARRHSRTNRCNFLKLINELLEKHLPKVHETFDVCLKEWKHSMECYLSEPMSQLKGFWAAVTKYHHQGWIKREMEKSDVTAALANREVVFFVASALITFPVLGALMFLSS
ncbi:PREDICTED: uncharacterized protein LOC104814436 [Tarenaya hassleriana]|uniref:uncharacterized protein LOC104814436 n=1 Tax=Tarenaya hassleriana TaxID=28532 RepID=UPI00053C3D41|nr:PREDICTED: uncharacterized protein LOC104814436 [Tarenaya hassleriana]